MEQNKFNMIVVVYALLVAAVLSHFPILTNEIVNWHDDELFSALHEMDRDGAVFTGQGAHSPVMMAWFWLQYQIGGDGYFIYHAASILLHAVNAVLLFLLLMRIRIPFTAAAAASALFAVHPIHTQTLAFISNQSLPLSFLFLLCGLYAYNRYASSRTPVAYGAALLCTIFFYLTGSPALYVVIGIAAIEYRTHQTPSFRRIVPFILLWLAASTIEFRSVAGWGFFSAMMNDTVAFLRYGFIENALRILIPDASSVMMHSDLLSERNLTFAGFLFPALFGTAVMFAALVRNRYPELLIGVSVAVLAGTPFFAGELRGEWVLADTSFYGSSVGWYLCAGVLLVELIRMFVRWKMLQYALTGAAAMLVVILMTQSYTKAKHWKDGEVFWNAYLQNDPDNIFALTKKGLFHFSKYEMEKSFAALDRAVDLAPKNFTAQYTRAFVNLGAMYPDEARRDYLAAAALDSSSAKTYFGLGSVYSLFSRHDSAITMFTRAIALSPDFYEAYNNRANVYNTVGKYIEAFSDYRRALMLNPQYADAYGNRALLYLQTGNAVHAMNDFKKQTDLVPNHIPARVHAGLTAVLLSDTTMAILQLSKAQAIDSDKSRKYIEAVLPTFLKTKQEIQLARTVLSEVYTEQ